ncbi:hypothetical protein [Modestobacter altitudinis]|uniref:hypothetical protein n=1 Tax=Modestobacter altitudinis TaxID=2213158 RepID=UPI00110CE7D4|nr:hypothetical protein [Modestobacter altitudinis]
MTEAVDPDPVDPAATPGTTLGGRQEPSDGDPTAGGKRGDIGTTESIAADEPDDGSTYPVGGGRVEEESNASPVADPGPDDTP